MAIDDWVYREFVGKGATRNFTEKKEDASHLTDAFPYYTGYPGALKEKFWHDWLHTWIEIEHPDPVAQAEAADYLERMGK